MSPDATESPPPGDASGSVCPLCGGALIPIVYGYPGPGLMDEADAGRVRLGGCVVMGNDPAWECTVCERSFNTDLTEAAEGEESVAPTGAEDGSPNPGANRVESPDWDMFQSALADALAGLRADEDRYFIVSDREPRTTSASRPFVQFAISATGEVRAETTSERYLGAPLDAAQLATLADMGWSAPSQRSTGEPVDGATDAQHVYGSPNYFRDYSPPVPYADVAEMGVRTLREVWQVPAPSRLNYKAFRRAGGTISLAGLRIPTEDAPREKIIAKRAPCHGKTADGTRCSSTPHEPGSWVCLQHRAMLAGGQLVLSFDDPATLLDIAELSPLDYVKKFIFGLARSEFPLKEALAALGDELKTDEAVATYLRTLREDSIPYVWGGKLLTERRIEFAANRRTTPGRWSDYFSRSSIGDNVFYCRVWPPRNDASLWEDKAPGFLVAATMPFNGAEPPSSIQSSLFSSAYFTVAFLDGGLYDARRIGWSGNLNGSWVLGYSALRYMCDVLNLEQPRRLKGELRVLPLPEVFDRLRHQLLQRWTDLEDQLRLLQAANGTPAGLARQAALLRARQPL